MKNRRIISWNIRLCIGALSFFSITSHAEPKPVLHKATARIHVMDTDSSGNPYFLRTQIEIIQSKPILYEVANRLNLAGKWSVDGKKLLTATVHGILKKSLHVDQQGDTSLIAISVQRTDSAEAARIANEIANTYRDYYLELLERENRAALAIFETALKKQKDRVAAAEKKVEQLRVECKMPADGGTCVDVQNMRLMRLENERFTTQMEMIKKKAKLKILKDHANEDLIERASFISFDQMILNIIQQIQDIKIQTAFLETEQGDDHPELKQTRLQKQKLEKTLAVRLEVLEKSLKSEYALAEAMFGALDKELDDLHSEAISLHKKAQPYRAAITDLESERVVLKQLEAKLRAEMIRREVPQNPVEIISPAKPPQFRGVPQRVDS